MERARVAALAALLIVGSLSGVVLAGAADTVASGLAAVAWPPSTGLLVSELQTGGASASDEFVELTNGGGSTADLGGLEVVYVTSTGGTVTRKATWSATRPLAPGQHLLLANASGGFAAAGDATYSGGLAATGGTIVLRPVGGAPIDAVGWGDATNAFVEGAVAPAPPAGSSLERKPGGLAGNAMDTNSNAADFFVQGTPNPQNLAAPPVPAPTPSATSSIAPTAAPSDAPPSSPPLSPSSSPVSTDSPTASEPESPVPADTPLPSALPSSSASEAPTVAPSDVPSAEPTASPEPTTAPSSAPSASPEPTAPPEASPSSEPTSLPSPSPTATPTTTPAASDVPSPTLGATPAPVVVSVAAARGLPDGSSATVVGVLTTQLGALEAGRKGFLEDATGGIAVYLDAALPDGPAAGSLVQVSGTLDDRYAERTLRASVADVLVLGTVDPPTPIVVDTGAVGEPIEGTRVTIVGTTSGVPGALADGLGVTLDDGSGAAKAVIGPLALGSALLPSGTRVSVTGPIGQHDSSGTGATAYRVYATLPGELAILPPPSPEATPTSSPAPSPTPSPPATPDPTPTPAPTSTVTPTTSPMPSATPVPTSAATPTPTPIPSPTASGAPSPVITIVQARSAAIGATVTVEGVVTAEAGRLGAAPLIAIADGTGGIVVRVPASAAMPGRGTLVRVRGPLADPYGQLEIRPTATGIAVAGTGALPTPQPLTAAGLGEATEGRLVQLSGVLKVAPTKGTDGALSVVVAEASGATFRVVSDGSSGIRPADLPKGVTLRLTGIVGQHASRKGGLDGYRLWLRDRADVTVVPGPTPSPGGGQTTVSVAMALAALDGTKLVIEAMVTAGTNLLDASGRRIVVQDGSGAIEVLLPSGEASPAVGTWLAIAGEKAHAWGAPRLRATTVAAGHPNGAVGPALRAASLTERDEWHLVRVSGSVLSVHRIGDRWQAEIRLVNGDRVPVIGQSGAGIPSSSIVEGRAATIVGIVRRPYPTATDRRFALLPRGTADVTIGPGGGASGSAGRPGAGTGSGGVATSSPPSGAAITPDTDLATLSEHVGGRVHVGGLVTGLTGDGFLLDDGTAVARVALGGDAIVLLPHLRAGDALAAWGTVRVVGEELVVDVGSAQDLVRVGDLGQALPVDPTASATPGASAGPKGAPSLADAGASGLLPEQLSVATLAGLSAISVLVTLLRRRALARRSRAIVVARLSALARPRE